MNSNVGQKKNSKVRRLRQNVSRPLVVQIHQVKAESQKRFSSEAFKTDGCYSRLLSCSAAQEAEKLSVDFWCLTVETCHISRV